jgi:hypothetical protein
MCSSSQEFLQIINIAQDIGKELTFLIFLILWLPEITRQMYFCLLLPNNKGRNIPGDLHREK